MQHRSPYVTQHDPGASVPRPRNPACSSLARSHLRSNPSSVSCVPCQPLTSTPGLYPPLDSPQRQFGLLRLRAQQPLLDCELAVLSSDATDDYEALSYRWGEEDASLEILVNSQPFRARRDLYNFLQSMDDGENYGTWICIDAICINQQDLPERSFQVGIMDSISRNACEVIAWVDNEFSSLLLKRDRSLR